MTASWTREAWLEARTVRPAPGAARRLLAQRDAAGVRLGLVIACRDDVATLGKHLLAVRYGWAGGESPWDPIAVADLGSRDGSPTLAEEAGAAVLVGPNPRAELLEPAREGEALHRALVELDCDIVLVFPARLARPDWDAFAGLVEALLRCPEAQIAFGFQNPADPWSELQARPLLSALAPDLSVLADPFCPVLAGRTEFLRTLPIAATSGYEPALAVSAWRSGGLDALVQAPVGHLAWHSGHRGADPLASFRSMLATLEALRAAGCLLPGAEFGHLHSALGPGSDAVLRECAQLGVFPWHPPARELRAD